MKPLGYKWVGYRDEDEYRYHYVSNDGSIEVFLTVHALDKYWWVKIIHVDSKPRLGEMNMSSDRADVLAKILRVAKKKATDLLKTA